MLTSNNCIGWMFKTVLQNLLKWFLWSLMECYLQLRHCYLNLHVIYFHFVLTPDRLLFTKIVQEGCIFGVLDPVKRYVSMCVWSICAKLLIYLVWYLIFFLWPFKLGCSGVFWIRWSSGCHCYMWGPVPWTQHCD